MSRLRGFQHDVKQQCYIEWHNGAQVVMPVISTGGGKTVLMGDMAREYAGEGCAIAHRHELVSQISVALANEGVRHNIIGSTKTIKAIVNEHMQEFGKCFYDVRGRWTVASVDTLVKRDHDRGWLQRVGMVYQDEGHHVLRSNKWGKAMALFPNARGMLPTATPSRADGRGLGRHADGLVDSLIEGPDMRWMIDNAYLTDYVIRAPTADDLDLSSVDLSAATGDYNQDQMRAAVKRSTKIIANVVQTYLKYARGKRGITFAADVEHAGMLCEEYLRNGVPAQVVTADTPDGDRLKFMRQFRAGELLQLVNVDLFGEGVDVPACQCVSMARPTASYSLYVQQFGRALRLMVTKLQGQMWDTFAVSMRKQILAESDKPIAMIFDHVGNVIAHMGPPDRRRWAWTLDARERRSKGAADSIPLRTCPGCEQPYERIHPMCPYCGMEPAPPADRNRPENVDGDLALYSQELMDELFGKVEAMDAAFVPIPYGASEPIAQRLRNIHAGDKVGQGLLREAMRLCMPPNMDERTVNRRFYHWFGIDTLSAKALGSTDAAKLRERILSKLGAAT